MQNCPNFGDAVAQPAHRQAFRPLHAAPRVRLGASPAASLRASGSARSQGVRTARAGSPATLTNSTMSSGLRFGQHALELGVRVALLGHRERGAELHRRGTERRAARTTCSWRIDAAGGDQRNALALDRRARATAPRRLEHRLEVKARVVDLLDAASRRGARRHSADARSRSHRAAGFLRIHFFSTIAIAARVGQDRNQRDIGKTRRHLRQVERQPRAHHHRVRAALAGLAHIGGVCRRPPSSRSPRSRRAPPASAARRRISRSSAIRLSRSSASRSRVAWRTAPSGRGGGAAGRRSTGCPPRRARATVPASRCADTPTPMPPCTMGSSRPAPQNQGRESAFVEKVEHGISVAGLEKTAHCGGSIDQRH